MSSCKIAFYVETINIDNDSVVKCDYCKRDGVYKLLRICCRAHECTDICIYKCVMCCNPGQLVFDGFKVEEEVIKHALDSQYKLHDFKWSELYFETKKER